jgi:hypothetical protein
MFSLRPFKQIFAPSLRQQHWLSPQQPQHQQLFLLLPSPFLPLARYDWYQMEQGLTVCFLQILKMREFHCFSYEQKG